MTEINAVTMPKWGLSMDEGIVAEWLVNEGDTINTEDELLEIETSKITNVLESAVSGQLRRQVASEGDTLPVGDLLGIIASQRTTDAEIDQFIESFRESFAKREQAEDTAAEPVSVDVHGQRIVYLHSGATGGEAVVFVHGFGSDHKSWLMNQEGIAQDHPTYALDLPGHGASGKTLDDASAEGLAETVAAFVDTLDHSRIHLVGHSFGAAICAFAAEARNDKIASLTLISPAGLGGKISKTFLDGILGFVRARKLRGVLEMLVFDDQMISSEMVEDILKFKRLDGAQASLEAIRSTNFPDDEQIVSTYDLLGQLDTPIQFILGANDQIIEFDPDMLSRLGTVRIIEKSGHIPQMEKSTEVNELIISFLDSHLG